MVEKYGGGVGGRAVSKRRDTAHKCLGSRVWMIGCGWTSHVDHMHRLVLRVCWLIPCVCALWMWCGVDVVPSHLETDSIHWSMFPDLKYASAVLLLGSRYSYDSDQTMQPFMDKKKNREMIFYPYFIDRKMFLVRTFFWAFMLMHVYLLLDEV